MATFVDLEALHATELTGGQGFDCLGYHLVVFYERGPNRKKSKERERWISENLKSIWYTFRFGANPDWLGRTYVFKLERDAIAFKLRWAE